MRVKREFKVLKCYMYCICQIFSVSRGSDLVKDNLKLGLGGSEIEHGFDEILTKLAIEPCSAQDYGIATYFFDILLPMRIFFGLRRSSRMMPSTG